MSCHCNCNQLADKVGSAAAVLIDTVETEAEASCSGDGDALKFDQMARWVVGRDSVAALLPSESACCSNKRLFLATRTVHIADAVQGLHCAPRC